MADGAVVDVAGLAVEAGGALASGAALFLLAANCVEGSVRSASATAVSFFHMLAGFIQASREPVDLQPVEINSVTMAAASSGY